MNKGKKIFAICVACVLSVSAIIGGSFAFFVDRAEGETDGQAGAVTISMGTMNLTNSGNINPGDNDETKSTTSRGGTSHDLTFNVENQGNKSIMTRNVVTIEVEDGLLPAYVYSLKTSTYNELTEKYYSLDGSTFVLASTVNVADLENVVAVRYITPQVALNGVGANAEIDADDSTNNVEGASTVNNTTAVEYTYLLKLAKSASDEYEKSTLDIKVEVQAMQYRNTGDEDWVTLFTDMLTIN